VTEEARRVSELRLVVTATDYAAALHFYRDVLGLREQESYEADGGHVVILDAGRATLEINDPPYAAYIDEVEVGRRVAGTIRVAFEVPDTRAVTGDAVAAGAELIAEPTVTPWDTLNSRLAGPAQLQLTLFGPVDPGEGPVTPVG
jgi:catechol 2,3-dioxygenase-like lactoylglutathione lyase family enzyme